MSFPFRAKVRPDAFNHLVKYLRSVVERFPDERTGDTTYSMADAALGAFSVFFTQSPSFLDFQRHLQVVKGCNNALTLFGIEQIPSDNQTRNLLDPVPPSTVLPVFAAAFSQSCFSWPSCGVMNSGSRGITRGLPGATMTGVTTVWE